MGVLMSLFSSSPKETAPEREKIRHHGDRFKTLFATHYRGIVGTLGPLLFFTWQGTGYEDKQNALQLIWLTVMWVWIWMPVNIVVGGMMVVFLVPMCGILDSATVCKCFFDDNIVMLFSGHILGLLLCNSGIDRRLGLKILSNAKTTVGLVIKAGLSAFILALLSNKLLVTDLLIQLIGTPFNKYMGDDNPDCLKMTYVVYNVIQTSASIGSIPIFHGSYANYAMRGMYYNMQPNITYAPDMMNYMQWFCVATPLCLVMLALNIVYHLLLFSVVVHSTPVQPALADLKNTISEQRRSLPAALSLHELYSIFFLIVGLVLLFTRFSPWMHMGWSGYQLLPDGTPGITDATVLSILGLILHSLPKSMRFTKIFTAKKRSEIEPLKPESGILFFKFVDKNVTYAYVWILGAGNVFIKASQKSGLMTSIALESGKNLSNFNKHVVAMLITIISAICCNVFTPIVAMCCILPYFLCMMSAGNTSDLNEMAYIVPMIVGACGSCSFLFPYLYSPAHHCYHKGKTPIKYIAIYSLPMAIMSCIFIYLFMMFYTPLIYASDTLIIA